MKKVKMILTNRFDPDVRVYKEAKYLVDNGLDVEILCWDRESEYSKIKESVIDGIKIKRFFPYSEYGTGFKQLRPFVRFINECKEYLKNKEYQYLHCHDLDGVIAGYFIKNNYTKFIFCVALMLTINFDSYAFVDFWFLLGIVASKHFKDIKEHKHKKLKIVWGKKE